MSIKDFFQKVDRDKLDEAIASDNPQEMRSLGKESGMTLSDEQLDYVAGGVGAVAYGSEAADFAESYGV